MLPPKLKKEKPVAKKRSAKSSKRKIKEEDEVEAEFEDNFSNNDDKCGSDGEKSSKLNNAGEGFDKDSDNLS